MATFDRLHLYQFKYDIADPRQRIIAGYASTTDIDRANETVSLDALRKAMPGYMANPVVTWQHDWSNPVGVVQEATVDERGAKIRARISRTAKADEAWTLIEDGVIRSLSIGFKSKPGGGEQLPDGSWRWNDIDWVETALVSVPANPEATFSIAKSLGLDTALPTPAKLIRPDADGQITWRSVAAAMCKLLGARGGMNLSPAESRAAFQELSGYYKTFDKALPTFEGEWPTAFRNVQFNSGEQDLYEDCDVTERCERIAKDARSVLAMTNHWTKTSRVPSALVIDTATSSIAAAAQVLKASEVLSADNRRDLEAARDAIAGVITRDDTAKGRREQAGKSALPDYLATLTAAPQGPSSAVPTWLQQLTQEQPHDQVADTGGIG